MASSTGAGGQEGAAVVVHAHGVALGQPAGGGVVGMQVHHRRALPADVPRQRGEGGVHEEAPGGRDEHQREALGELRRLSASSGGV